MSYAQPLPLQTLLRPRPHSIITWTITKSRQMTFQANRQSITASSSRSSSCQSLCSTKALPRTSFTNSLPTTTTTIRRVSTASTASPSQTVQIASTSSENPLTWNEFLRLRRIRRYYNLGASIGTSFTTLGTGMATLSQQNLSALGQQLFGLDPFVLVGLCAVSFWGVGWLLGPLVGTGVFQLLYRTRVSGMAAKEKDFFERIKKYRVDPSSSSMQNPPPDYYGEKITSVAGYRRWLKDQRAFNKKRQSFV